MRNLRYLLRNQKGATLVDIAVPVFVFTALIGVGLYMIVNAIDEIETKYSLTPAASAALEPTGSDASTEQTGSDLGTARIGSEPNAASQIVASDASVQFGWLFDPGTQVVALEGALDSEFENIGGPLLCVGSASRPQSYRLVGQEGDYVSGTHGYSVNLIAFRDKFPIRDQLQGLCGMYLK